MYGGTLIGNKAYNGDASFGGAVSVQAGHFEMHDGKIIGNYSMYGAVDTRNGGDGFIMRGGEISYNTATYQGGGVCMGGGGIATISGGKITNNTALGYGEGHSEAGGIVFRNGASKLNISGNPIIKDNAKGDVYLWSGKKLTITGEIGQEASIGITIAPASGNSGYASGVFTDSADTSFNVLGSFFSNSSNYAVGKNSDGQLFLGSPIVTLTYDGNGATGGNVPAETTGYASGSAITVPGNTNSLVKTGLVFDGWNTMADGSGTAYAADQAFTITANTTLYAQWSNIVASVTTSGGVTTEYADLSAALNNWTEGSTLRLYADANLNSTITVNNTKTLDLNGFGMIRKYVSGTKGARNQGVFDVMGGDLTIIDSNADVVHRYKPATDGAGRATDIGKSDGTASFTGGYITGDVYGVSLGNQGTLNFKGGTIIGHERTGIWIEPGTLNMSDNAAIIANSSWGNGGGVELENGTFKMTGGTISNNMAKNNGGGIFCADQNTTLQLLGGSITGNVVKNYFGGGVHSPGSTGTFEISGNVSITDNKKSDGTDNNVWLWNGAKISITGALSDGAQIGITMNTPGVFTSSSTVSNNDASKFSSDSNDYSVMKNADEQLYLGISYTVTFKVVNGSWNDETSADKTVTLTGYEGDTLKLAATDIPAVGSKPNDTYKAGSWDVTPNTDTAITEATTYTYTYVAKEASVVTKAPEAKTLTYNGQAQELVTAGTATGGEMQYALGTKDAATEEYTTTIPSKTDAGTYYVWYMVVGNENYNGTEPACVEVTVSTNPAALSEEIDAADNFYNEIKEDYPEIADELSRVIKDAVAVKDNPDATQDEINAAEKAVKDATSNAKEILIQINHFVEGINDITQVVEDNKDDIKDLLASYDELQDSIRTAVDNKIGRAGTKKLSDL
ncbi:MAG: InlB B-repeat-containing protein, partial [Acutalibacteraceae bacterium]|nr:InlB B-repeat-containing protein [Acutalibacteraceae bacterium]